MQSEPTQLPDNTHVTVPDITPSPSSWWRFLAWCWHHTHRFVSFLGLLLLFFILLLFLPAVQTWLAQGTAQFLSNEIKTNISIQRINISLFGDVALRDVFIADKSGDTLLYAHKLSASVNVPLAVVTGLIQVNNVSLNGATIKLQRKGGEWAYNYDFLLNLLETPDDGAPSKPLFLNLSHLDLHKTKFSTSDAMRGNSLNVYIENGTIHLGNVDTKKQIIHIEDINIDQPAISIRKWVGVPATAIQKEVPISAPKVTPDTTKSDLKVLVKCLQINKGNFALDNFRPTTSRPRPDGVVDFRHLKTFNIHTNINQLVIENETYKGNIQQLSLEEKSGFILSNLYVKEVAVSNKAMSFHRLHLQTPYSSLRDTFSMRYKGGWDDFDDFNNTVKMAFRIADDSYLGVTDLIKFDLNLYENPFFKQNIHSVAYLSGKINGSVNNLSSNELKLHIGETAWRGNFSLNQIDDPSSAIVRIQSDQLNTSMSALKLLIPNFNVPENFYKLGKLNFDGTCAGAFDDFVIKGNLITKLGRIEPNMRLDLLSDKSKAKYSGNITLDNFDLRQWTDNPNYGFITATAKVEDGQGLTLKNAKAKMAAAIPSFSFKGYTYKNIAFNGELSPEIFNGTLGIKDQNIDFSLTGKVDIDTAMRINIKSKITKLDLKQLKLDTINQYILKGDIDLDLENVNLQRPDWDKIKGRAKIYDFSAFLPKKKQTLHMDSLLVQTTFLPTGERLLDVKSDLLNGEMKGRFAIKHLDKVLQQYLFSNFIEFCLQLGLKPQNMPDIERNTAFDFKLAVNDENNLLQLFVPALDTLRNLAISGNFSNKKDAISLQLLAPHIKFNDISLDSIALNVSGAYNEAKTELTVKNTTLPSNFKLAPFHIAAELTREDIKFGIKASDFNDIFNNLNIKGNLVLHKDTLLDKILAQIRFDASDIQILNHKWSIKQDNYIRFGGNYLAANNFVFSKDDKIIDLSDINKEGLSLKLRNFDFIDLNEFINYDEMKFDGQFNADITIDNIFKKQALSARLHADTLMVNCEKWGEMDFRAAMKDFRSPIISRISLQNGEGTLITNGEFYPKFIHAVEKPANYFDFYTTIHKYPFKIAEYFIGDGIKDTHGTFNANIKLFGTPDKPHVNGKIHSQDGGTTIKYLNTHYTFPQQFATLSDTLINVTGAYMFDKYKNKAKLRGGITHQNFKKFGIDADIHAENFLVLDTDKVLNPDYYGRAIGRGDIHFGGTFKQTDIIVKKFEPMDSSILNIPVRSRQTDSEVSFIKFKPKNQGNTTKTNNNPSKSTEIKGIYFEMATTVNDRSQVNLIFDEKAGDVIKGHGNGTMNVKVYRSGELELKGNYEITKGDYLFTLYNVVNKNFKVNKGRIEWTGDPLNANIDLVTEYQQGLSTSPYNFISEYIQRGDASEAEARKPTPVKLQMMLKGQLLQPDITFALGFPNLTGQIKNITDTKLALIAQEPNELNRQVFGLVMMGSFLPADVFLRQGLATSTAAISNTFTQLLSNQLSIYISELLSDVLVKKGLSSGVDFNFNYLRHDATNADLRNFSTGNEIQVRFKNQLFNDRLSVQVGGNFINNTTESGDQTGYYFLGDVVLEYSISRDQRFKVRAYRTPEQSLEGNRYRTGLGLTYRQEFDSLQEFWNGMRKMAEKAVEN